MHRIAAQVASNNRTSLVHIAFAGTALVCLLVTRTGLASDEAGAGGSPSLAHDQPTTATMPSMARADLDDFTHRTSVAATPPRGTDGRVAVEAAKPAMSSLGTIAEPATVAVLGFTTAALIALRRRRLHPPISE